MNFWIVILNIYLIVSFLNLGLNLMIVFKAREELRRKYPEHKWVNELTVIERVISMLRSLMFMFCPLLNVILFFFSLFTFDDLVKRCVEQVENTFRKEAI